MDKVKRDRSINFSLHERDILVSLIKKYRTVIENKQSGASTWKMKEKAWRSIQDEFNARSGGTFRSAKTLKIKYEGLKRTVRKKSAARRSELYRTGDKNTTPPLDNVERKIKRMISLGTDGLESVYDSDTLPKSEDSLDVKSEATQNQLTIECDPLSPTTSAEIGETSEIVNEVKANIPKKYLYDELTQAKLEIVKLQKEFLEAEIAEKKKVWKFEEIERKKEAEFKEKERKWKEEEYKLRLQYNFK